MIDFIKWVVYDKEERDRLWRSPLLQYRSTTETRHDDELREVIKKEYENFYFRKYSDRIEVEGSLHKLKNKGIHNADDFYTEEVVKQIQNLEDIFNLNPKKCHLIGLEFAVNITPRISNKELILRLKYHGKNEFQRDAEHLYSKRAGTRYLTIKAYAKDLQYPQYASPNTFRFEVKTKKREYIKRLGINTLSDLKNKSVYEDLGAKLMEEWGKVLLMEHEVLKEDDKYLNLDYWERLIFNKSRNAFYKAKKRYAKKVGEKSLHHAVKNKLNDKIKRLLRSKKYCNLYTFAIKKSMQFDRVKNTQKVCNLAPFKIQKKYAI